MITDFYLAEIAKAMNSESTAIPSHLAVGTTVVSNILTTDTAIAGEIGTRVSLSRTRTANILTLQGIRSGANVINTTNGDDIKSSGVFSQLSTGTLLFGVPHGGITQTTNFDIEYIAQITVSRS